MVRVGLALVMACYGAPSSNGSACTNGDVAPLAVLGSPDRLPAAGTWAPGRAVACRGNPTDMICFDGGAMILGDSRATRVLEPPVPERLVQLSPFALDIEELRVGIVRDLINQGKIGPPMDRSFHTDCTYISAANGYDDKYPLNCVTRSHAAAICSVLGKRLPTEAEWEWAAGGLAKKRLYPWDDANADPCDMAIVGRGYDFFEPGNVSGSADGTACRARSAGPVLAPALAEKGSVLDWTAEGLHDTGGNLGEWVQDDVVPYSAPCWAPRLSIDPVCKDPSAFAGTRGATWRDPPEETPVSFRHEYKTGANISIGIRCAKSM